MCGRYAASRNPDDLVEEFEIRRIHPAVEAAPLPPSYNIAPTDPVYVVLDRPPRDEPAQPPERQLRIARWGLVPSWAQSATVGSRMINARMETVAEKPAFRRAMAARRCLVPADGYFEWMRVDGGKQPYFIHPRDSAPLAMAGLYEFWRDRARAEDDPDAWLLSCAILTTRAEDTLGRLHDRMPLIVERGRYDGWLDPEAGDPHGLRALLVPAAPGRLDAYPVSRDVGNVRNNASYLVQPLPADAPPAEVSDATPF
jgi:putative SOS response-associated peptidase YedK